MKRNLHLSLMQLFLLVLCFSSLGVKVMSFHSQEVYNKPPGIDEYLAVVRNKALRKSDPKRVVDAILGLGKLRAFIAVDDLTALISFRRTLPQEENAPPNVINEIHVVVDPFTHYPATAALLEIGKPSLPALMKVIRVNKSGSLESHNAIATLIEIFRESPSEGLDYLQSARERASSPREAQRLSDAILSAKKSIKPKSK